MYRSLLRPARGWRGWLGGSGSGQQQGAALDTAAAADPTEDGDHSWPQQLAQFDTAFARGRLRHNEAYTPPDDLEQQLSDIVHNQLQLAPSKQWLDTKLTNPGLKFKLLDLLAVRLRHAVPNSELADLTTVRHVLEYYSRPVHNTYDYARLARSRHTPSNLNVVEHATSFHPDDTDAEHGGVTATPGEGGQLFTLRAKRFHREFNPKKKWYDFENKHFDYTKPPEDAPWQTEQVKRNNSIQYKINKFWP